MPIFAGTRQVLLGFRPKTHIWTPAATVPTYGADIVTNGGFDVDTAGWSVTGAGAPALDSIAGGQAGNCLRITNGTGQAGARQTLTVVAGTWYWLDLYQKNGTGIGSVEWGVSGPIFYPSNANWTQTTRSYRAGGASVQFTIYVDSGSAGVTTLFDTVSVKPINFVSMLSGAVNVGYKNGRFSRALIIATDRQAGLFANLDNPLNPQNYVYAYVDRITAKAYLLKVLAGTPTELVSGAITYATGASPEIRVSGTTYQLWYNGAQVGTDQTVTGLTGTWAAGFDPDGTATGQMQAVPQ